MLKFLRRKKKNKAESWNSEINTINLNVPITDKKERKNETGERKCIWCKKTLPANKKTFCSLKCHEKHLKEAYDI